MTTAVTAVEVMAVDMVGTAVKTAVVTAALATTRAVMAEAVKVVEMLAVTANHCCSARSLSCRCRAACRRSARALSRLTSICTLRSC